MRTLIIFCHYIAEVCVQSTASTGLLQDVAANQAHFFSYQTSSLYVAHRDKRRETYQQMEERGDETWLWLFVLAVVVILGAPSNQLSTIPRLSLPLFILYAYRWKINFKRNRKRQNLRLRKMYQPSFTISHSSLRSLGIL